MAVMELWRRRDLEGAVKTEYIDGNFFSQDSVGNLVGVKVYKDGAEVALTGSVTGYCVLPSGETVSVAGTRSGNQASILVPQSALAYTGPLGITLKLIDGNTITTLMSIIVVVCRSKTDTVITPSSQIITDWSNQIAAALQEVEDASAEQDEKIDDLKSALVPQVNSLTDDVYGTPNYTVGIRLNRDGTTTEDLSYCTTPYIETTAGAVRFYYGNYSSLIFFVEYDSNKNFLNYYGASPNDVSRNIPALQSSTAYVRFTFNANYAGKLTRGSAIKWEATRTGGINNSIENIEDDIESIATDKSIQHTFTPEITSLTYGYVEKNGNVNTSPGSPSYYSNKIPVQQDDVLTRISGETVRMVCAYNGDTAVTSAGTNDAVTSYTVPSGIDSIVVSISGINSQSAAERIFAEIRITRNETRFAIITDDTFESPFYPASAKAVGTALQALENQIFANNQCYTWRGSLLANIAQDMGVAFAPKIGFSCGLYGELSGTFGGLTLQFDAYSPNQIIVSYDSTTDAEKVTVLFKSRFIGDARREINMKVENTFSIMVYADNPNTIKVTIYSNGVKETVEANFSITAYEPFQIINGNSALSDVIFTIGCATINHSVWVFGDSYLGMKDGDTARWPHYAYENGYVKNAMFCGSTGSGSEEFNLWYDSLIAIGRPKTVVCCMGMNYPSDGTTAPTSTWKTDIEKLIAESQVQGFDLILATIPSIPTKNNEQKNAYVRNSGYRYIDFAKAVGAQADGTWYAGMLASDNVHPTITGAIALYSMAISSVPELTYDYK